MHRNCKLCKWSTGESEKLGLYGNIYYFVVDYEAIIGHAKVFND